MAAVLPLKVRALSRCTATIRVDMAALLGSSEAVRVDVATVRLDSPEGAPEAL